MSSTWSEVLDALEHEVGRLAAATVDGPREHEPMRDVVGETPIEDLPTSPLPPELVERAEELHDEMTRITEVLEQQMRLVHGRILDALPRESSPVFLDARF